MFRDVARPKDCQTEWSQSEREKYCVLMHTCGIEKNGTDEPICKAEIETRTKRTNVWNPMGRGGRWDELGDWYWHYNENLLYSTSLVGSALGLYRASLVAQRLQRLPPMRETQVRSLGWEEPLEKEMVTHSSILSWRIPWMEEPGRLQSTGSQKWDTTERLHCIAQRTLLSAPWWPKWEGNPKKRGHMYTLSWFTFLYTRN